MVANIPLKFVTYTVKGFVFSYLLYLEGKGQCTLWQRKMLRSLQ